MRAYATPRPGTPVYTVVTTAARQLSRRDASLARHRLRDRDSLLHVGVEVANPLRVRPDVGERVVAHEQRARRPHAVTLEVSAQRRQPVVHRGREVGDLRPLEVFAYVRI
jgi:hypothetical protein